MKMRPFLAALGFLLILSLALAAAPKVEAAVVGQFTEIVGRVDLMKGGKLPVIEVKLNDPVETGDIVRTKSESKAQITFIDKTTLNIAPDSRMGVEEFTYDAQKEQRRAVLQIFRGLVHTIVSRVVKLQDPDFIMKTNTAVLGVRGTEWYTHLTPRFTDVANVKGLLRLQNVFAEVKGHVELGPMTSSRIGLNLTPTVPISITKEDLVGFQKVFSRATGGGGGGGSSSGSSSGSGSSQRGGAGSGTAGSGGSGGGQASSGQASSGDAAAQSTSGTGGGGATASAVTPTSVASGGPGGSSSLGSTTYGDPGGAPLSGATTPTGTTGSSGTMTPPPVLQTSPTNPANQNVGLQNQITNSSSSLYVPPESTPAIPPPAPPPPPPPSTYTFQATSYSAWQSTGASDGLSNTVTSSGWAQRTGTWPAGTFPEYYTTSGTGTRTLLQGSLFPSGSTGTSMSTVTGTVTGVLGQNLTGPVTITSTDSYGQTMLETATVTIEPSGRMSYNYTGTMTGPLRSASASGTNISTPGTYFTQTLDGVMSKTSSGPYKIQNTSALWAGASSSGLPSPYYALALTGTATSYWPYTYLPQENDSLTGTMAGVVSPTSTGGLQGAATINPTDRDAPFVSALPSPPSSYLFSRWGNNTPIVSSFNIDPTTGILTGTVQATDYQDGKYAQQVFNLTQTPQASPVTPPASATYAFAQTYNGSLYLNPGPLGSLSTTLQAQGMGWGQATGVANPSWAPGALALPTPYTGTSGSNTGWFVGNDQGTWNVATGFFPYSFGYGAAVGVTQMRGTVTGIPGQTLTGSNMSFIGSLLNGISFNYVGPVTLDSNGQLKFTYTGSWTAPGGTGGTASGILQQYPGYRFDQTTTGNYTFASYNLNPATGKYYNATLTFPSSDWTRTGVYSGTVSGVNGTASLYSPDGTLPASGSGSAGLSLTGVVGTSENGATTGAANLIMSSPFNTSIPGYISLTPGGSFFNTGGAFVQPTSGSPMQLQGGTLAQTLYSFSETYQGFRLSTGSAPFTLANVEGYGWGTIAGTGANPLPVSYTGNASTGYFVSQDLGTRASATAMTPGFAGVTASMTGTLSGVLGNTLSGQVTYTGTNSRGTSFNYQGNVTLGTDGRLTFYYGGTWTNGSNSGTGSGTWTQVLGTYFSQTITSGTFVQSSFSTTSGGTTYNIASVKDAAPLSGTQTLGSSPATNVTTSYAGSRTSTVNPFPASSSGPVNLTMQGVVAGSSWDTRWGVATISGSGSPTGSTGMSGPVTLDTSGKLSGQFVDVAPNGSGNPVDNVTVNLVSVPTASGQTTSSFVQTVSGTVTQTPTGSTPSTQGTLTTPTPLTGTSTGVLAGNINANLALASTAAGPVYGTTGSGPITAQIVGAVGGPAGGAQTGAASVQAIKTIGTRTHNLNYVGTATFQPAVGGAAPTLTTSLKGLNLPSSGVSATQSGTVRVTPR